MRDREKGKRETRKDARPVHAREFLAECPAWRAEAEEKEDERAREAANGEIEVCRSVAKWPLDEQG